MQRPVLGALNLNRLNVQILAIHEQALTLPLGRVCNAQFAHCADAYQKIGREEKRLQEGGEGGATVVGVSICPYEMLK